MLRQFDGLGYSFVRHRGGKNSFRVFFNVRVALQHFAAAVTLVDNLALADNFSPGAVRRRVEINPGHQPVPALRIQFHAVMTAL